MPPGRACLERRPGASVRGRHRCQCRSGVHELERPHCGDRRAGALPARHGAPSVGRGECAVGHRGIREPAALVECGSGHPTVGRGGSVDPSGRVDRDGLQLVVRSDPGPTVGAHHALRQRSGVRLLRRRSARGRRRRRVAGREPPLRQRCRVAPRRVPTDEPRVAARHTSAGTDPVGVDQHRPYRPTQRSAHHRRPSVRPAAPA